MLQRSISLAAFVCKWRSFKKFETGKPEALYSQNKNSYKKTKSTIAGRLTSKQCTAQNPAS